MRCLSPRDWVVRRSVADRIRTKKPHFHEHRLGSCLCRFQRPICGDSSNWCSRPVAVIHPSGCIAARTSEVPHQAASPALCGRRNALARPPARTIALKRSATVSCVRRLPRDSRHGHLQSNDSLPRMNERSMTTVDCVISITWSGLLPRTLLWFDDRLMLRCHAHTDDAPRGLHKLMCKPAVSRNSVGPRSD